MRAIRVGVVGFGLAGKVFHAPMIHAVDGLELAGVVERNGRNAEAAYPGITTFPSLDAMLDDASIELIVVATPNDFHVAQARQALAAGRHVVVDKPVGNTSFEIADLMVLARKQKRLLIPFHNRRFDGDFMTLRKLLAEQKLGRVVSFESTFDRWRPAPKHGTWRDASGPGTGTLFDLGTHLVDQAVQLFGLPEAIGAEVLRERDGSLAVDAFTLRLHLPGGLIATISANCLAAQPRPHYLVRGTRGGYIKWGLDPQEDRLRQNGSRVTADLGVEPPSAWGSLTVDVENALVTHAVETVPGDYRLYYAAVRDALLGKTLPPVLDIDSWRVASILEMAEESQREGRVVPCDWAIHPTDAPNGQ
uniref:Putative oxidoreductase n=1 Tax=mine drainage metagenome TaxID=410659 RepID=E6QJV5_9ZZZZ